VEECHQRVLGAMQLALDQLTQERRQIRRAGIRGESISTRTRSCSSSNGSTTPANASTWSPMP
jgi:hypothetical protein